MIKFLKKLVKAMERNIEAMLPYYIDTRNFN